MLVHKTLMNEIILHVLYSYITQIINVYVTYLCNKYNLSWLNLNIYYLGLAYNDLYNMLHASQFTQISYLLCLIEEVLDFR